MAERDLGDQRRDYDRGALRKEMLADDPIEQFSRWYKDAEENYEGYPNPMVLSTVDKANRPRSRVVLLKSFDQQGFVFYTNYTSSKATDIEHSSEVSLLFFWEPLERQIHIRGKTEKFTNEAADEYFASRPRKSQLSAWASSQSQVLDSRQALEDRYQGLEEKYQNQVVPRPPQWGGYIVQPYSIEFWQGQPSRLHDRLVYTLTTADNSDDSEKNWSIQRLSP